MSPRPGPARPLVAIRIGEKGLAAIDTRAKEAGLNRSEMMRLMLAYAAQRMPKDWTPDNKGKQK